LGLTGSSLCFEPIQQVGVGLGPNCNQPNFPFRPPPLKPPSPSILASIYQPGAPTHPVPPDSSSAHDRLRIARRRGFPEPPATWTPEAESDAPIVWLGMKSGGGFLLRRRQDQTRELVPKLIDVLAHLRRPARCWRKCVASRILPPPPQLRIGR
jgi:hypothetical protein